MMSACSVVVSFDDGRNSFETGEEVTGTVVVTAETQLDAQGIRIRQVWRAHGRGNTNQEVVAEQLHEAQRLMGGVPNSYPFRFTVPARPVSYHGHFINLDHYVEAAVDVAWKIDPTGEADYIVKPGAGCRESYVRPADKPAAKPHSGCLKVIGWILLPLILVLLVAALVVLLPILLVAGAVKVGRMVLAERRLGDVTLEIHTPTIESGEPGDYQGFGASLVRKVRKARGATHVVSSGQTVVVRLHFTPRQDVSVSSAEIKLAAQEVATSGSGTNSTVHRHTLWEDTVTLLEPGFLRSGRTVDVSVPLTLPQTDAMSLTTSSNTLRWTATIRIVVPGWPDWVREHDLLMVPEADGGIAPTLAKDRANRLPRL